jgi:hypothetical protein
VTIINEKDIMDDIMIWKEPLVPLLSQAEPVLLNVYGAPELIPRNEFRQPM